MSYYMRMEDADGNLIVGTEIDGSISGEVNRWIDKMSGEFVGKVKLYDLNKPTQTIEVTSAEDRGTDGVQGGNETDGSVLPNQH